MTDPNKLRHPNSAYLRKLFKKIRKNRSLGSHDLTTMLLEELLIWSLENNQVTDKHVRSICEIIVTLRPEMAAVYNTGYLLWSYFRDEFQQKPASEAFPTALRKLRGEKEKSARRLIAQAREANFTDYDVLTFSRSSTVLELLKNSPTIKKAVVLHSFPGEEGIDMAEDLKDNLEITFAYDVEAGYFLPKVDALYLGVDSLLSNGDIVNKTGSRLLASAAGETAVRAVLDVWKYSPVEALTDIPRYPSPADTPATLQRQHPMFETVPAGLIDSYITGRGIYSSGSKLFASLNDLQEAYEALS
ncbi:MAG: hypothetical protein ACLFN5_06055 [bacterium]